MFTQLDLTYLAGFFDADGSVSIVRLKNKELVRDFTYQVQVIIAQNPPCPIMDELLEEYGGKIYKHSRHKVTQVWRCPASSHIRFLKAILPYLRIKKEAAQIAIEYQVRVNQNPTFRPVSDDEFAKRTALYERMQDFFDSRGLLNHSRGRERRA